MMITRMMITRIPMIPYPNTDAKSGSASIPDSCPDPAWLKPPTDGVTAVGWDSSRAPAGRGSAYRSSTKGVAVSAINEFPWQETILRALSDGRAMTLAELASATIGSADPDDRGDIEADVDHLVEIGLAERHDDHVQLTAEGRQAAGRLP